MGETILFLLGLPLSFRRSRARALSLLNLKKKINCSQSVYDEKTETHTSYLFLLKLELDNALQEFKRSINPQFVLDG